MGSPAPYSSSMTYTPHQQPCCHGLSRSYGTCSCKAYLFCHYHTCPCANELSDFWHANKLLRCWYDELYTTMAPAPAAVTNSNYTTPAAMNYSMAQLPTPAPMTYYPPSLPSLTHQYSLPLFHTFTRSNGISCTSGSYVFASGLSYYSSPYIRST
ncbi:hypothetical protein GHT06_010398 [Daphnia sinensis]|uniref:Uncharacterized protein n=1 Tax=Daphnia sinensis TaxID=1820382 RepID=A0AAD5L0Y7_9CRUS|nr:hypothetical protein GHT06_010398 [Daphnia sinensis]